MARPDSGAPRRICAHPSRSSSPAPRQSQPIGCHRRSVRIELRVKLGGHLCQRSWSVLAEPLRLPAGQRPGSQCDVPTFVRMERSRLACSTTRCVIGPHPASGVLRIEADRHHLTRSTRARRCPSTFNPVRTHYRSASERRFSRPPRERSVLRNKTYKLSAMPKGGPLIERHNPRDTRRLRQPCSDDRHSRCPPVDIGADGAQARCPT